MSDRWRWFVEYNFKNKQEVNEIKYICHRLDYNLCMNNK